MGYLADTHLALWLIAGSDRLPKAARTLMEAPGQNWYLSVISVWEVMLKHQAHPDRMLIDAGTFLDDCEASGFRILPLRPEHMLEASRLPIEGVHKDPFDRILLAQACSEGLTLVSHDRAFEAYGNDHVIVL